MVRQEFGYYKFPGKFIAFVEVDGPNERLHSISQQGGTVIIPGSIRFYQILQTQFPAYIIE
ncbi:hypothetical protein D9M69_711000 [compost metagenome]